LKTSTCSRGAINRWMEWYKCRNAPFQIKKCSDSSRGEAREENGPKYLKNYYIFLFLNSYYILYRRACHFQSVWLLSLWCPITHAWLEGSLCSILSTTGAREALFLFQQRSLCRWKVLTVAWVQWWGRMGIPHTSPWTAWCLVYIGRRNLGSWVHEC
jgi:hypothetical protein